MWLFLFPDLSLLPEGPWASCSPLCLGFPISEMGAMPTLGLLEEYMKPVCVLGAYMSHSVTGWLLLSLASLLAWPTSCIVLDTVLGWTTSFVCQQYPDGTSI